VAVFIICECVQIIARASLASLVLIPDIESPCIAKEEKKTLCVDMGVFHAE
jgi:hypothetical protein